jgi:hypothetical protein
MKRVRFKSGTVPYDTNTPSPIHRPGSPTSLNQDLLVPRMTMQHLDIFDPPQVLRSDTDNRALQALLFSYSTPGIDTTYKFDRAYALTLVLQPAYLYNETKLYFINTSHKYTNQWHWIGLTY